MSGEHPPLVPIGDLARSERGAFKIGPFGSSLKKSELVDRGVAVLGIENVLANHMDLIGRRFISSTKFEELADYAVQPGDILVTTMGTIGRAAVVPERPITAIIDSHLFRMRVDARRILPRYLAYALNSEDLTRQLAKKSRGAIMDGLNTTVLKECVLRVPPLWQQQAVLSRLDIASRLLRTRRYTLEMSEGFLGAVFLEMFGDPGKRGDIPRKQLSDLFPSDRDGVKCGPFGTALKNQEYIDDGVPVWTMVNITPEGFNPKGSLFVTPEKAAQLKGYSARKGDVLISRAGTVGRMAIIDTGPTEGIIHTNLVRITLDPSKMMNDYFVTLMTVFGSRVARLKRGQEDAYSFLSAAALPELLIPVPCIEEQRGFSDFVRQYRKHRKIYLEAIRQSEHLFQTLLHEAFGEGE